MKAAAENVPLMQARQEEGSEFRSVFWFSLLLLGMVVFDYFFLGEILCFLEFPYLGLLPWSGALCCLLGILSLHWLCIRRIRLHWMRFRGARERRKAADAHEFAAPLYQ